MSSLADSPRPYVSSPATASPAARPDFRIAAIDIGSNSLHMAIAQADTDGSITTLWRMKEMVGLGRISFPSRNLSVEAMDRAISTLGRFQQAAKVRECEKILAIATSAVREAENGGEFLERAWRELGMRVRVVSAKDEARLIYLGVRHAVDLGNKPHFIVDIGGGSVEFIVADSVKAALLESRKLGATRMTAHYIKTDPVSPADLKSLAAHYDRELSPLCQQILELNPVAALGTSGTMENLAAMCASISGKPDKADADGTVVEREPMAKLVNKLLESRSAEREKMPGLDDQRKDHVIAGAVLVNELFRRLDLKEIRVCRSALREGILLDYLGRHLPELHIRRQAPDPRRRSVLDLARRCHWQQAHGEHVAGLTVQMFDQLKSLHELRTEDRELIEFAALLHDIGWHIARDSHHKHSQYLILNGNLKNFAEEEVRIIAAVARYHRKSAPDMKHDFFAALSKHGRNVVRVGTGLLRIADSLDRTHCQVVSAIKCKLKKNMIQITAKCRGDAELELWAAKNKSAVFEDTFDRAAEFGSVS